MDKRPNILWFVGDQMRHDAMFHAGNAASKTPNFDSLVEDGVSFENAYCQNPVCVPSRCSFLTGLYPHTTGHRTMHYLQRNQEEPNLLKEMKQQGYEVVWIGRNDVLPADKDKSAYCDIYYDGFKGISGHIEMPRDDDFYSFYIGRMNNRDGYGVQDWHCIEKVLEYLDTRKECDKPFFIYCTLTFPHPPYACEDPWYSAIDRSLIDNPRPSVETLANKASMLYGIAKKQKLQHWSDDQFIELKATYLAMVSRLDYQFGLVKQKLIDIGAYDNTSIFVFSDHGDYTGDYHITEKVQNCFEDPVCNVPLIIKPARQFEVVPRITKALAELVDLPCTVASMCGFSLSYTEFGQSLLPVLAGSNDHKDAVFCEGGRIHGEIQAMERGHGPESPYYPRLDTQASEGPEHTKACMIRMGNIKYTMRLYEKDELYDLDKDPMELVNEIDNPEYLSIIARMKERMLYYYMETGDFVPQGKDKR